MAVQHGQPALVWQPPDSVLCGQACVAMVVGVDLAGGIELVGHGRPTRTADVRRGLVRAGRWSGDRCVRPVQLPAWGLARCRRPGMRKGEHFHWLVVWGHALLDPLHGLLTAPVGGYLSSVLMVEPFLSDGAPRKTCPLTNYGTVV